jgi:hypothetical protein
MPHYDLDGRLVILSRLPELLGGVHGDTDTRYRIYTQDFLPWGALPLWEDGGPQTIALTDWTVQYLVVGFTSCDEPGYDTADLELYIHREVPWVRCRELDVASRAPYVSLSLKRRSPPECECLSP